MTKPTTRFDNPFAGRMAVCFDCRTSSKRTLCPRCRQPMRSVGYEVPRQRDDKGWARLRRVTENRIRDWMPPENCTNQANTRQPKMKSWRGILRAARTK